jgi:hypothetical protein
MLSEQTDVLFRFGGTPAAKPRELDPKNWFESKGRDYLFLPPPLFAMPLMC